MARTFGYKPGPADGILGHQTRNAIEAFQRDRGLPVTGEASAWLALRHWVVLASAEPRGCNALFGRHQLSVYQGTHRRPPISSSDRLLWSIIRGLDLAAPSAEHKSMVPSQAAMA